MMFSFLKKLFKAKLTNAAIAYNQAGFDAGNYYWLYAAPVHLVLQRDTFSMSEPAPLLLEAIESDALTAELNKHFAGDNMQFFWHNNSWFLRCDNNPDITTHTPQAALNKAVGAYLPTGDGAIRWATFTNEVQMLLFEHPINTAREAKGLSAINSIWCYGGGQNLGAN